MGTIPGARSALHLFFQEFEALFGNFGLRSGRSDGIWDSRMVASCMSTEQEGFAGALQPLPALIASGFLQILQRSWSRTKTHPPASRTSSCGYLGLAEGVTGPEWGHSADEEL